MPVDPTLKMRPGRASDIAAMVDIFLDAFSGNPIGQTFFPRNAPATHKFWTAILAEEMHDPDARFLVVAADAADTPVAFAKWIAPLAPGTPAPPMPAESDWPANQPAAAAFFKKLADMHEQLVGRDRPHWFLEMMVVRGEDQGRGAGGLMMAWGAARADQDGVEAYLDATPAGKSLYERFGFRDGVEPWPCFDETYRHSFMVRTPGGKDAV